MRPWNLLPSPPRLETVDGRPMLAFGWQQSSGPFDQTSSGPARLFGHLILDGIPDEALPEVLELLGNAWVFYQPGPPQIEAPQRRPLKGKVTRRYERPAYSLVDEE